VACFTGDATLQQTQDPFKTSMNFKIIAPKFLKPAPKVTLQSIIDSFRKMEKKMDEINDIVRQSIK
jgi:hypothetical protein